MHIAIGPPADGRSRRGVATGWIAIASAQQVQFAPGALPPWSAIPHHEFLWSDAALLILLVGAMLGVVATVHFRRRL